MSGSLADSIAGLGAIVLTILGLVGVFPMLMASLVVIALGAGFLLQGASATSRYRSVLDETPETRVGPGGFGTGVAAESIGGLTALTLGILALLGLNPLLLVSIAVIVFGGTMILGSTMVYRLNDYLIERSESSDSHKMIADQAARGSSDIHLLAGVGAVVLGILALVHPSSMSVVFVGLLAVGAANLLTGGELVNRLANMIMGR